MCLHHIDNYLIHYENDHILTFYSVVIAEGTLQYPKTEPHSYDFPGEDEYSASDGGSPAPSPLTPGNLSLSDSANLSLGESLDSLYNFNSSATTAAAAVSSSSTTNSSSSIPNPPDIAPLLARMQQAGTKIVFTPTPPHTFSASSSSPTAPSPGIASKNGSLSAGGKSSRVKKSKSKTTPKSKVIKFHEYKGPPSANRAGSNTSSTSPVVIPPPPVVGLPEETPYHVLLQQQQLFLQWQLEFQQTGTKSLPVLLPQNTTLKVQGGLDESMI